MLFNTVIIKSTMLTNLQAWKQKKKYCELMQTGYCCCLEREHDDDRGMSLHQETVVSSDCTEPNTPDS